MLCAFLSKFSFFFSSLYCVLAFVIVSFSAVAIVAKKTNVRFPIQKGKRVELSRSYVLGKTLVPSLEHLQQQEPDLYDAMLGFIEEQVVFDCNHQTLVSKLSRKKADPPRTSGYRDSAIRFPEGGGTINS